MNYTAQKEKKEAGEEKKQGPGGDHHVVGGRKGLRMSVIKDMFSQTMGCGSLGLSLAEPVWKRARRLVCQVYRV